MKQVISPAIVLRHTDYSEADRIVSVLTPDYGRLKGFAKSARKSRKRFGAGLEPFAEVELHWVPRTSGELVTLRQAELVNLRPGLRRDLETISLASHGCELVEVLLDDSGATPEAFALLRAFLDYLDVQGYSVEARLLFELRLLELSGYGPHLQHCAACNGALPAGLVGFSAAANGSLCNMCGGDGVRLQVDRMTLGSLGRILQTPLTKFDGFRLTERSQQEGLAVVADALTSHLPRPLKSLAMLKQFEPFEQPG